MKLFRIGFVVLITISAPKFTNAQELHEAVPQSIEALVRNASWKGERTEDHSMLVSDPVFFAVAGEDDFHKTIFRKTIPDIRELSIHRYYFSKAGIYEGVAGLSPVRQEYHAAGWKWLASMPFEDEGPSECDVWTRSENHVIGEVAILCVKPGNAELVNVSGAFDRREVAAIVDCLGSFTLENWELKPNTEPLP